MNSGSAEHESRCHCGHLLAKVRKGGIELKCKRCKHLTVIPLQIILRELPSHEGQAPPSSRARKPCVAE